MRIIFKCCKNLSYCIRNNISRLCLKSDSRSFNHNSKLYWYPISQHPSKFDSKIQELSFTTQEKVHILSFAAGIGFLIAAVKIDNTMTIFKHLYNQSNNNHGFETVKISDNYKFRNTPLISCGRDHTLIYGSINNNSQSCLISFGNNTFGQCSNSDSSLNIEARQIQFDDSLSQIACGLDHSIVVTKSGRIFSCGLSTDGQTGLSTFDNVFSLTEIPFTDIDLKFTKVSTCSDTSLAITDNNRVFGWGNNEYGHLFSRPSDIQIDRPIELHFARCGVIQNVLALGSMCLVITEENKIYAWGLGVFNGISKHCPYPTEIHLIDYANEIVNEKIVDICGSVHFGVLKTNSGRIFVVGNYPRMTSELDSHLFVSNELIFPEPVIDVSCGSDRIFVTM